MNLKQLFLFLSLCLQQTVHAFDLGFSSTDYYLKTTPSLSYDAFTFSFVDHSSRKEVALTTCQLEVAKIERSLKELAPLLPQLSPAEREKLAQDLEGQLVSSAPSAFDSARTFIPPFKQYLQVMLGEGCLSSEGFEFMSRRVRQDQSDQGHLFRAGASLSP